MVAHTHHWEVETGIHKAGGDSIVGSLSLGIHGDKTAFFYSKDFRDRIFPFCLRIHRGKKSLVTDYSAYLIFQLTFLISNSGFLLLRLIRIIA